MKRHKTFVTSLMATVALGTGLVGVTTATAAPAAAATQVVNLANPGNGNPGMRVDAVIDHGRGTVTVLQRFMSERSRLTAAWVNLRTGASGRTGLPEARPATYPSYPDRAAVLPTGTGPVVVVVYGPTPSQTGLIPTLNAILPLPHLLTV
ncbi:hypothetical protein [Williamsia deligens]|uniref:Uncharacterized protein n=1 Tax=Williamsia deligens TaxID=321325 RepID=A0ABW3GC16_9NOCA|nr:hypothetical protein [Williamsia deligens]MCP2192757.1 hypothetical protein [Williamsia deligens]